jgi:glycosyltransferase involved in cell wall biosynthesis
MKIINSGNIANNGYYNFQILKSIPGYESTIVDSWTNHAMSDPAWEEVDFVTPNLEFVMNPDWSRVPGAMTLQSEVVFYPQEHIKFSLKILRTTLRILVKTAIYLGIPAKTRNSAWQALLKPTADFVYAKLSKAKPTNVDKPALPSKQPEEILQIIYGPPGQNALQKNARHRVLMEHGTLRWIEVGLKIDENARKEYSDLVSQCSHIWVTNLDPKTLGIASKLADKKWSAFPHPYKFDSGLDLATNRLPQIEIHDSLSRDTQSKFVIFLPSSINWLPDHDKGSLEALEAFAQLRKDGFNVGLVCVEWGRQVSEAKNFVEKNGLLKHVKWIIPQPRIELQRIMKSCDIIWDQFGEPGFGALTIKAMEVGAPLVTVGLSDEATKLIGEAPQWLSASNREEIQRQTIRVFESKFRDGWEQSRLDYGSPARSWLVRRHHQDITRLLQLQRYEQLRNFESVPPARPDAWAQLPDYGTNEWHNLTSALEFVPQYKVTS